MTLIQIPHIYAYPYMGIHLYPDKAKIRPDKALFTLEFNDIHGHSVSIFV